MFSCIFRSLGGAMESFKCNLINFDFDIFQHISVLGTCFRISKSNAIWWRHQDIVRTWSVRPCSLVLQEEASSPCGLPWTCSLQGSFNTMLSGWKLYKYYPAFKKERKLEVPQRKMRLAPRSRQWKSCFWGEYATLALWEREIQKHECPGGRAIALS